jgi:putative endonuclease
MEVIYVTYILYSSSLGKYYIGQTDDFEKRFKQHNSGQSKFTKQGVPWNLVWQMEFFSRSEAVKLETQIKKRGAQRYLENIVL